MSIADLAVTIGQLLISFVLISFVLNTYGGQQIIALLEWLLLALATPFTGGQGVEAQLSERLQGTAALPGRGPWNRGEVSHER